MSSDDFFTDEQKNSIAYGICVTGTAIVGGGSGFLVGFGNPLLGIGGLIGGLVVGLKQCPAFTPAIKQRLLSGNSLDEKELRQTLSAVHQITGVTKTDDLLYLLAHVRVSLAEAVVDTKSTVPPSIAAGQLLKLRATSGQS